MTQNLLWSRDRVVSKTEYVNEYSRSNLVITTIISVISVITEVISVVVSVTSVVVILVSIALIFTPIHLPPPSPSPVNINIDVDMTATPGTGAANRLAQTSHQNNRTGGGWLGDGSGREKQFHPICQRHLGSFRVSIFVLCRAPGDLQWWLH